jgi:hypothetical protein
LTKPFGWPFYNFTSPAAKCPMFGRIMAVHDFLLRLHL